MRSRSAGHEDCRAILFAVIKLMPNMQILRHLSRNETFFSDQWHFAISRSCDMCCCTLWLHFELHNYFLAPSLKCFKIFVCSINFIKGIPCHTSDGSDSFLPTDTDYRQSTSSILPHELNLRHVNIKLVLRCFVNGSIKSCVASSLFWSVREMQFSPNPELILIFLKSFHSLRGGGKTIKFFSFLIMFLANTQTAWTYKAEKTFESEN